MVNLGEEDKSNVAYPGLEMMVNVVDLPYMSFIVGNTYVILCTNTTV